MSSGPATPSLTNLQSSLYPGPGEPYLSWPGEDTAGRFRGTASILGLTGINRHADSPITAEALVAGTQVLVWTSVNAGGVGVADGLKTWVYRCRAEETTVNKPKVEVVER